MAIQRTLLDGDTGAKFSSLELLVGEALAGAGGNVAPLSNVIFVDAGAPPAGDGSIGKPFQTIAAGVAALTGGGTLMVAPNSYIEDPVVIAGVDVSILCMGAQNQTTLPSFTLDSTAAAVRLYIENASINAQSMTVTGANGATVTLSNVNAGSASFTGAVGGPIALELNNCFAPSITTVRAIAFDVDGGAVDGTIGMFNAPGLEVNLRDVKIDAAMGVTFPGATGKVNVDATANFWYSTNGTTTGGTKAIQASVT